MRMQAHAHHGSSTRATLRPPLPAWQQSPRCLSSSARRPPRSVCVQPAACSSQAQQQQQQQDYQLIEERGVTFTPGQAFYRAESAQGRDLAVLAAAVYRRQTGRLRVLDVMAGSGMRGARYLQQAGADLVWCNDYDKRNNTALVYNLVSALQQEQGQQEQADSSSNGGIEQQAQQWRQQAEALQYEGLRVDVLQWQQQPPQQQQQDEALPQQLPPPPLQPPHPQPQQPQQARVTHVEARRLLASVYLQEDYFDLVDCDSFGSDTSHLAAAIDALRYGGMLYLTSTDGMSAGGKRPQRSLAAYGAHLCALPSANEQGLRMLIGAAVKEGAARGVSLTPLFSLYSYHGPVFRVMLRAERSNAALNLRQYSFVGHCYVHGQGYRVGWRGLSSAWCRCVQEQQPPQPGASGTDAADADADSGSVSQHSCRPTPLVLSGPMWTGPLHDAGFVSSMSALAAEWGWSGSAVPADSPYAVRQSKNNRQRPLQELLQLLAAESSPELPPWFVPVSTLAQFLSSTPIRDRLIGALQARGFAACACHVERRALRTNATTAEVLQAAVEDCGYKLRGQHDKPGVPQALLDRHGDGACSCHF